ncbi:hypothetical protein KIH31_15675 [Paenarthrobacter sp. DKR-5]|uniref:hypothetical protein n=1 Tax=Paenarthrobacter sp. DKR-5 TaxID=2835535 RepID=UPI001BDD44A0|nr:hypothetical protein [Paenarthrobacter sp. DKR-5]MBT1004026.1 hypothetical protein [Paenarthrobacter sp. DKR-5]
MGVGSAAARRALFSLVLCGGLVASSAGVTAANAATPASVASETAAPAPDPETSAAAQAVAAGQDVAVPADTTPTETTVAHPDGTFTRTVSSSPVRMQTSTGWADISTDLTPSSDNGAPVLTPKMVPVALALASGGATTMATLDDKHGHTITQSWPFGSLPAPVVSGNTATYPSVLPGVDLIQVAHDTGVSQVLRIRSAAAAADPRVAQMHVLINAANAVINPDGTGGLTATGTDTGQVALRTMQAQWWDSSQPGASATDPGGPGITRPFPLSLGTDDGQQSQVFGMDKITGTPGIQYPIYVDPDWSASRTSYLYVDSAYPTTNYWNGQYTDSTVHVGYLPASWAPDGVSHVARGFYQFVSSALSGKTILSARLDTTETWSSSCTATPVSAWVTGGVGTGTTWNAQPSWMQQTDSNTIAHGYSSSCPAATVGFDMAGTKGWLTNSPQWTVGLRADNESDSLGWKRFSNTATLAVTYDTAPNTPGIYGISGGLWSGTAWAAGSTYLTRYRQPTYTVSASDPDGSTGGNISVSFDVYTAGGTHEYGAGTRVSVPGSGGKASWAAPSTLPDGAYQLRSQAVDSSGVASGTMTFNFTIDTKAPTTPVVAPASGSPIVATDATDGTDSTGVVGKSGYDFTITNTNPDKLAVTGFIYAVTSGTTTETFPSDLSPTDATCGKRLREFVVVCPSDGFHATVHVTALDATTAVTAWAYNKAGNVSATEMNSSDNPHPYQYVLQVGKEPTVQGTVLPFTLHGATRVDVATLGGNPQTACQDAGDPSNADGTAPAIQFTNPGDYAETAWAVDTSKSFSVAAWVCPSTTGTTPFQSLITQMAGTDSTSPGGGLRIKASTAELATWGAASSPPPTEVAGPALSAGTWYYVTAVYDQANQQLRISQTTTGYTSTWTYAFAGAPLAAPSTQPVLLGAADTSGTNQFTGQILRPVFTQNVLSSSAFANAQSQLTSGPVAGQFGVLK